MSYIAALPIEVAPQESRRRPGGEQHIYRFANDYGASVAQGPHTYGGPEGKWELAVLWFDGEDWDLVYDTPVTADVLGWLTVQGVAEALAAIAALPERVIQ